jgi:RNA polymerase sigma factor (sigma-70 family)
MSILEKNINDSVLLEGIKNQDDKVINYIYDNYYNEIKNYILQDKGSIEDASDVFQDTIIMIYNQVSQSDLSLTTDFKNYFFTIARNIWKSQLRKKERIEYFEMSAPNEPEIEDKNEPILEKIVMRTFMKLKSDQQMTLNLFIEGNSYEEIARKMNLKNASYARRKKNLARKTLMNLVVKDPEYVKYLQLLK